METSAGRVRAAGALALTPSASTAMLTTGKESSGQQGSQQSTGPVLSLDTVPPSKSDANVLAKKELNPAGPIDLTSATTAELYESIQQVQSTHSPNGRKNRKILSPAANLRQRVIESKVVKQFKQLNNRNRHHNDSYGPKHGSNVAENAKSSSYSDRPSAALVTPLPEEMDPAPTFVDDANLSKAPAGVLPTQAPFFDQHPSSPAASQPLSQGERKDGDSSTPVSPTTLAYKIKAVIESLPSISSPSDPSPPPKKITPKLPKRDPETGRPIPPEVPLEGDGDDDSGKDRSLFKMLWSATIMNGGKGHGDSQVSVWSILESLGKPPPSTSDPMPGERQDIPKPAPGGGKTPGDDDNDVSRDPNAGNGDDDDNGGEIFSDGSSVMMYSPLLPTNSSLVELADYVGPNGTVSPGHGAYLDLAAGEVVAGGNASVVLDAHARAPADSSVSSATTIDETGNQASPSGPPESVPGGIYGWWKWSVDYLNMTWSPAAQTGASSTTATEDVSVTATTSTTVIEASTASGTTSTLPIFEEQGAGSKSPVRLSPGSPLRWPNRTSKPRGSGGKGLISDAGDNGGKIIWVPSTTKLSFQAMWWGYRLYLPPPIMEILDDKQLEAAKRAALITSALTWFFSHIPLEALPIAVRPAVALLQTLVPYIGYIGTFISWSWSTIKSYDTGWGVILTATWLLPIALLPGTWEERDFPTSPPPPPPPDLPTSPPPAPPSPSAPPPTTSDPAAPEPEPLPSIPIPPTPVSSTTVISQTSVITIETTSTGRPKTITYSPTSLSQPLPGPPLPPAPSPPTIPLPMEALLETDTATAPETLIPPPAPAPKTIPLPDLNTDATGGPFVFGLPGFRRKGKKHKNDKTGKTKENTGERKRVKKDGKDNNPRARKAKAPEASHQAG